MKSGPQVSRRSLDADPSASPRMTCTPKGSETCGPLYLGCQRFGELKLVRAENNRLGARELAHEAMAGFVVCAIGTKEVVPHLAQLFSAIMRQRLHQLVCLAEA